MSDCPTCGKVAYRSRYDAKRALRAIQEGGRLVAQRGGSAGSLRPYRCPVNDRAWHLGHDMRKDSPR